MENAKISVYVGTPNLFNIFSESVRLQASSRLVHESFETSYDAKKLVLKSFRPSKTTRLLPVYHPYTRQTWKSGSDLGFLLGFGLFTRPSSIVNFTTLVIGKTSNSY